MQEPLAEHRHRQRPTAGGRGEREWRRLPCPQRQDPARGEGQQRHPNRSEPVPVIGAHAHLLCHDDATSGGQHSARQHAVPRLRTHECTLKAGPVLSRALRAALRSRRHHCDRSKIALRDDVKIDVHDGRLHESFGPPDEVRVVTASWATTLGSLSNSPSSTGRGDPAPEERA